jgi:D-galactarolactone cycloisomerase
VVAAQLHATKPCELNDPSPRMHAVFVDPPQPKDGLFHLPNTPGLGLTLVDSELAQRRVPPT